MAVAQISDQDIVKIAEQYSVPPSLLAGVVSASGSSGTLGMSDATLMAFGMSAGQAQADPMLALAIAARVLSQSFQQTNSWQEALSTFLTGDPQAYQSPTSAVGGQIEAILGAAAVNPTMGLDGFRPADARLFTSMAGALTTQLQGMTSTGGALSQQRLQQYQQQVDAVAATAHGTTTYTPDPQLQQMAADVLSKMSDIAGTQYPATPANLALITTMARGEGMPAQDFNWLASTQGQGVGTVPGTPGVNVYGSYDQGIEQTARTFLNGNFNSLLGQMRSGADLQTMARNPGVQANLRTWQGGSSEDVNLLLGQRNVGGTGAALGGTTIAQGLQAAAQNNAQSYSPGECIAEGTLIATQRGRVPIETVSDGDFVWTRQGPRRVLWSGKTRPHAAVLKITTQTSELICTPDHRIWSQALLLVDVASLGGFETDQAAHSAVSGTERCAVQMALAAALPGDAPVLHDLVVERADTLNALGSTLAQPRCENVSHFDDLGSVPLPSPVDLPVGLGWAHSVDVTPTDDSREPLHDIFVGHRKVGVQSVPPIPVLVADPAALALKKASSPSDLRLSRHITHHTSRWTVAGNIRTGDLVWHLDGGRLSPAAVVSVEKSDPVDTYDLTVEGAHEFIANDLLVHNCTYYAARSLGFIPGGLGNAEDWASRASGMGMQVDSTPAVGTAVVYGPTGPYSPQYGHVAVVKQVNQDGTFVVSEMNVDGQGVVDERTSTMNGVIGFIHPPAGTNMQQAAPGLAQQVAATSSSTPQQQARQQAAQVATGGGNTGAAQRQRDREPAPVKVGEFASQLQAAGIPPQDFVQHFPTVAAAIRRDLGDAAPKTVDVSDFATAYKGVQEQQQPITQANLVAQVRSQPHPTYPSVSIGQVSDARNAAALHSITHTLKLPTTAEAARLAASNAGWREMQSYYQEKAAQLAALQNRPGGQRAPQQSMAPPPPQQQQQQQQPQPASAAPAGISDQAAAARQRAVDRG